MLSSFNGGSGVPTRYLFHRNAVGTVAYSPNGKLIATGSDGWTAAIWDAADPGRPIPLAVLADPRGGGHTRAVKSVAFSRDSKLLVTGSSDRTAKIWDVSTPSRPRLLATLPETTEDVYGLAFSPVTDRLAVGGYGNSARIYDISDPAQPVFQGALLINGQTLHQGPIDALAFSPEGDFLSAGDEASSAVLWYVGPLLHIGPVGLLNVPADDPSADKVGAIRAVAFGPDGRSIYTAGVAGRIRVFNGPDLLHLAHTATMGVGNDPMTALAVAPTGGLVAAGGNLFEGVPLFDPTATAERTAFTDPGVFSLRFSPDGRTLLLGGLGAPPAPAFSTRLETWDMRDPRHPARLASTVAHRDNVRDLRFSGDGRVLASVADRTVRLWDVSDPRRIVPRATLPDFPGGALRAAFAPDGRTLAVGGGPYATLWNVTDPSRPTRTASIPGHVSQVNSVAFSADGRTLVTGSGDNSVRVWDVHRPAHPTLVERLSRSAGTSSGIGTVAFSRDGSALVGVVFTEPGVLWDLDVDRVAKRICAQAGVGITRDEWARFLPDRAYDPPCD